MKLNEVIINCSRAILLMASIVSLIGWVIIMMMAFSLHGPSWNAGKVFLTFYPFIYLPLTIYGCLFIKTKRALIVLGVGLNLPLAVCIVYLFITTGEFAPVLIVGSAFITAWALLCLGYVWLRPAATKQLIQPDSQ
jgi:hypothetical protein